MPALAKRALGAPHPYVIGAKSLQSYLTIAEHCARAGKLRLTTVNTKVTPGSVTVTDSSVLPGCRPMNRPAVDYGLKQAVVQMIRCGSIGRAFCPV